MSRLAASRLLASVATLGVVAAMFLATAEPTAANTTPESLNAVSCPVHDACEAVGYSTNLTLLEGWTKSSGWVVQAVLPFFYLSGISCSAITACTAVGFFHRTTLTLPWAERWDGISWMGQQMVVPTNGGQVVAVSCPSVKVCFAVGQGNGVALVEHWYAGLWHIQYTPQFFSYAFLHGVTCLNISDCFAVGEYRNPTQQFPLAEHWNGTSWSNEWMVSPNYVTVVPSAQSVSCSTSGCLAVGYSNYGALVETRANPPDQNWSMRPSPVDPVTLSNVNALTGVSCTTAACTAVGWTGRYTATVAARWNGSAWTTQPTPSPKVASVLSAVSCPDATACTAVGSNTFPVNPAAPATTLAERWNGTAWHIQTTP